MKHVKNFKVFESTPGVPDLTIQQMGFLKESTMNLIGAWSLNSETGLIDLHSDFNCARNPYLSDFRGLKFGEADGEFVCYRCAITSLEGAPEHVEKDFLCQYNLLTSLSGSPKSVGGDFWCNNNQLISLDGAPKTVESEFWCNSNNLSSLEGAPREVRGNFDCEDNPLQTLFGAPQKIGGRFRFSAEVDGDEFEIPAGQWGPIGWVRALETIGDPKARTLILTLLDPDVLNKLFRDQPEQTMIDLQGVWNLPSFAPIRKQLRVPERYRDDMDLLGDMKELGF
jgi:hypothetical protein